jgi:hypothetical protein
MRMRHPPNGSFARAESGDWIVSPMSGPGSFDLGSFNFKGTLMTHLQWRKSFHPHAATLVAPVIYSVLVAALACGATGCGSLANPPRASDPILNRAAFLRILDLQSATEDGAPDPAALANSNGVDGRIVRFAELASALLLAGDGTMPDALTDMMPERWQIYWEYFQLARELARLFAPELAEQFDEQFARLAQLAPELVTGPDASSIGLPPDGS